MKPEYFLVDCEARGVSPVTGLLTEFGVVSFTTRESFHGKLFESTPDPANPAIPIVGHRVATVGSVALDLTAWLAERCKGSRPVFVSDNPAFDFMWIAGLFDDAGLDNPFGHSARRISDFAAGLERDWTKTQQWKKLRKTPHTHNPVDDAMGNAEALASLFESMIHTVDCRRERGPDGCVGHE